MRNLLFAGVLILGGCQEDGQVDPEVEDPATVTLSLTEFELPAGGETTKCQTFVNPFGGQDVLVQEFSSRMTSPGSHHFLVMTQPAVDADTPAFDCSGFLDEPVVYGAQQAESSTRYPDGVAVKIGGDRALQLQIHFLNATDHPVMVSGSVTFVVADASTITAQAGVLMMVNQDLLIPPGDQPFTDTKSCTMPADLHVLFVNSHMHKRAIGFSAETNGQVFYETDRWEEPPGRVLEPQLDLAAGQVVKYSCTWMNDTPDPIEWGLSAATQEMCNMSIRAYPIPDVSTLPFICY